MSPTLVRPALWLHPIVRGVCLSKNHLLVCRSRKPGGHFYLPGGHLEPSETIEGGLQRELLEELGLEFQIGPFLGFLEYQFEKSPEGCHDHEYNFIFSVSHRLCQVENPFSQGELDLPKHWVELKNLSEIDLKPAMLKTILPNLLLNPSPTPFFYSWQTSCLPNRN